MNEINDLYQSVGKNIREIRKSKGLTLEELAEKVNRDWSYLSQIERGKSIPSIETVFLISNALEIPLESLFKYHKPVPYKTDRLTSKMVYMVKDKSDTDKKRVINVMKEIFKKR